MSFYIGHVKFRFGRYPNGKYARYTFGFYVAPSSKMIEFNFGIYFLNIWNRKPEYDKEA